MFALGQIVTVRNPNNDDETLAKSYIGKSGIIIKVNTGDNCSVGQSPNDPFYSVEFSDETVEQFWDEELKK